MNLTVLFVVMKCPTYPWMSSSFLYQTPCLLLLMLISCPLLFNWSVSFVINYPVCCLQPFVATNYPVTSYPVLLMSWTVLFDLMNRLASWQVVYCFIPETTQSCSNSVFTHSMQTRVEKASISFSSYLKWSWILHIATNCHLRCCDLLCLGLYCCQHLAGPR